MEPNIDEEDHAAKLLKAQTHIFNHMLNFISSMSLKCAIELGIPDIIHNYGQPMPLPQLISSLPIHPSKTGFIDRLMRILIHSSFFAQQKITEDGLEMGFVLTDSSMLLVKDHPFSLRPYVVLNVDPILTNPWHQLSTWFQNDDVTPFGTTHGMQLWDYAGHEPRLNQIFNDAMACDAQLVSNVVVEKCKGVFKGLKSLVDVGGGTGTLAKVLAGAYPQLECTVLDLPHVVSGLQGSGNLKYVEGDMFEVIPSADACLLKCIMHDWTDDECVKILKKCKEAIEGKGKEGRVFIIDIVMESAKRDDESAETQLFIDMMMMVLLTGKERNEKQWARLIFSAGFSDYNIIPVLGLRSFIEVYP